MVYTVIVSLRVKPDMVDRFLEVMGENSRASRRDKASRRRCFLSGCPCCMVFCPASDCCR